MYRICFVYDYVFRFIWHGMAALLILIRNQQVVSSSLIVGSGIFICSRLNACARGYCPMRKIPVTTGLSFLPAALANDLIVSSVPSTMIGAA
jgi:hypothetical protein